LDLLKFKNLIFDLGGVVIDLQIDQALKEFSDLSGKTFDEIKNNYFRPDFFYEYEKGLISDEEFKQSLKGFLERTIDDEQIERAWNLMLGKINPARVDMLKRLSGSHKIYLLSNTNAMHVKRFNEILFETTGVRNMDEIFHKAYYSNEVNMRKPDDDIFLHVLEDSGLRAEESVFLDDTVENLETAQKLGINTFQVTYPDLWLEHVNGQ